MSTTWIREKLINNLEALKDVGVVGIKQSFEDEGVLDSDLTTMSQLCRLTDLKLSVKIGGCEAISDIYRCLDLNVNGIVAPMIESKFGLEKFVESIKNNNTHFKKSHTKFYINIESKQAYDNIDSILQSPASKMLTGIVVGRSDFTKSYGLAKKEVVCDEICERVYNIMVKAKDLELITLMGGNIGKSSIPFIKKLYKENLLDYIESRNVILKLNDDNTDSLLNTMESMLNFESEWLEYKYQHYLTFAKTDLEKALAEGYSSRSKEIKNRLK